MRIQNSELKRIHSLNDLFLTLIVVLTLPLNLLITNYAHGIVAGAQSDAHEIAPTLNSLVSIPSSFTQILLTIVVPIGVVVVLCLNKRFFDLLHCLLVILFSALIALILVYIIDALHATNITLGYRGRFTWLFGTEILSIPSYIAYAVGLLIILGPRMRQKFTNLGWGIVFICVSLQVILGVAPLMSSVMGLQIGFAAGFLVRYLLGQNSNRLSLKGILKRAQSIHSDIVEISEETCLDNRKRTFIASCGEGGSKFKIAVFDSDRQVLNILSRLINFLKFKNVDIKYTTMQAEFEHTALMNYAVNNAGLNYPKLLGATQYHGSTVFVFEGISSQITLLGSDIQMLPDLQSTFWNELNLAHKVGITYHKIDITDLQMYNFSPAIWGPENGDIASNSVFKHLDTAQLLVALALLSDTKSAVDVFLEHIRQTMTSKKQVRYILQTVSLLDKVIMPPNTKTELKARLQKDEDDNVLKELTKILQTYADNEADAPKIPIRLDYKRFSVGAVVSLGLTIAAIMALLTQLDFDAVIQAFISSNHLWALASFILGFITFLGGSLALKGFGASLPVKIWQAFQVQIAAGWSSVQLPAGIGPFTMNVRYLGQINAGDAKVRVGNTGVAGVVQVAQIVCSTAMLFIVGILSGQSIASENNEGTIILVVIIIAALIGIVFGVVPHLRKILIKKVWPLITQFISTVTVAMRNPRGVLLGFVGCLTQEMGYALSLWAALLAFNQHPSLISVILVFLLANAAGAATPTPGGLGAYEAALTLGLGTIGIPATVALSCTLLWRVIIFWVRAPMGAIMERYLVKKHLV